MFGGEIKCQVSVQVEPPSLGLTCGLVQKVALIKATVSQTGIQRQIRRH